MTGTYTRYHNSPIFGRFYHSEPGQPNKARQTIISGQFSINYATPTSNYLHLTCEKLDAESIKTVPH